MSVCVHARVCACIYKVMAHLAVINKTAQCDRLPWWRNG